MIAKIAVFLCIAYTAQAGYLGRGLGYSQGYSSLGYSSLGVAPSYSAYSAPVVAKAVLPAVYSPAIAAYPAPAISSSYIHSAPAISSYVHSAPAISSSYVHSAPISSSYVSAPVIKSIVAAPAVSYGGVYGHAGLGSKYVW